MEYVIFDLETSGLSTTEDRIVEIALYNTLTNKKVYYMVNPRITIQPSATAVHKISNKDIEDKPFFSEIAKEIFEFVDGKTLVGYNSKNFDTPILINEFKRCGITFEPFNQIDLFRVWTSLEKSHKLCDAYKRFCNKELVNAHAARNDLFATYEILKSQIDLYGINIMYSVTEQSPIAKSIDYKTLYFGKYKGYKIEDVFKKDPRYLAWMLDQNFVKVETKDEIKKIIER